MNLNKLKKEDLKRILIATELRALEAEDTLDAIKEENTRLYQDYENLLEEIRDAKIALHSYIMLMASEGSCEAIKEDGSIDIFHPSVRPPLAMMVTVDNLINV